MTDKAKKEWTTREAGKKGGTTTRQRHGHEHYQAIGKLGGLSTSARHGQEHYKRCGKKGGLTVKRLVEQGRAVEALKNKQK